MIAPKMPFALYHVDACQKDLFSGQALGQKSTIEGQRFSGFDLEGISVQAKN
jgi:hypothetical protein